MRVAAIGFLLVAACQPATPALPWVYGLEQVTASTGVVEPRAPADEIDDGCGVAASRPIELVADIAPAAGKETIVASYSGGIAIFDREDHLVAEAPGYRCEGSADELDVVAVGTAHEDRLLLLAATSGGRRESMTWIGLYRLDGRKLDALFTGSVELRDDTTTKRGSITFIPGGFVYQRPGGPLRLWRLDPKTRVYTPSLPDEPHDEPPLVSVR